MIAIHKFGPLPSSAVTDATIGLPAGAKILHCGTQRGLPYLWALVDTTAPKLRRRVQMFGTGWEINPGSLEHVGTFLTSNDALVWHVFLEKQCHHDQRSREDMANGHRPVCPQCKDVKP